MSQPPEYPGNPADPHAGHPNPPGYPPPPPGYGGPPAPPPGYGAPPPGYGAPPPGYGAPPPPPPPPGYGPPPGGYDPPGPPPPGYSPPGAPPPSPGYGAAPPGYPPQPGYGAPGGPTTAQFSIGDAISWSWGKFTQNAVALVVPALIFAVALSILGAVAAFVPPALGETTSSSYTDAYGNSADSVNVTYGAASIAVLAITWVLIFLVGVYLYAGLLAGVLDIADGKPVSIGSFFKPRNVGAVFLAALLVGIGVSIGSILCVIPGLIFAFLAQFTFPFIVDRSLSPVDSIKASITTARSNIGGSLLSWLVQYAAVLVGEALCGVGLIVAFPITLLLQVYTYRKLSGGQVVALEQPGYQAGPHPGLPPA